MTDEFVYNLGMAVLIVVCGLLLATAARAEELHDHSAQPGKFYSKWNRPKGDFSGIGHRTQSCCNRTDCSPVIETQMRGGKMYARFELNPDTWYLVSASVIESNQVDPLESPDDRAHGCVIGGQVACYVHGAGT